MIVRLAKRLLVLRVMRLASRIARGPETRVFEIELATALRTVLISTLWGRAVLGGYRLAMRVLGWSAIWWVGVAVLAALVIWQVEPWASVLAIFFATPALLLLWWRLVWGAPLAWLDEHADAERSVPLRQLPARLRELALEAQTIEGAVVPNDLAGELAQLAEMSGDG